MKTRERKCKTELARFYLLVNPSNERDIIQNNLSQALNRGLKEMGKLFLRLLCIEIFRHRG